MQTKFIKIMGLCDVTHYGGYEPMFWRNLLAPYSGHKNVFLIMNSKTSKLSTLLLFFLTAVTTQTVRIYQKPLHNGICSADKYIIWFYIFIRI
jgi:hypothetical protein